MSPAVRTATTVVLTAVAFAVAWPVWEYTQPLLRMALPQPARGMVLDFRLLLAVLAVFAALSVGNVVVGRVFDRLDGDGSPDKGDQPEQSGSAS